MAVHGQWPQSVHDFLVLTTFSTLTCYRYHSKGKGEDTSSLNSTGFTNGKPANSSGITPNTLSLFLSMNTEAGSLTWLCAQTRARKLLTNFPNEFTSL